MGRFRLIVTDDETHSPNETQVLFRQRLAWVVLLGAYLAVLCLPAHRALMVDQVSRVFTGNPPGWMRAANGEPGPARTALLAEARQYPQERDLQLGAVLLRATPEQVAAPVNPSTPGASPLADPRVQATAALRERIPEDPVVVAQLLRYSWISQPIRRKVVGDGDDTPPLATADLERMEQWCRDGIRLEPENGYFPTMLAAARFAAGDEQGALAALHQASVCATWRDYSYSEGAGARDLLIRTFGDRGLSIHALPMAAVLLPHLQNVRACGELGRWHAERRQFPTDEHRIRVDIIRLGSLIRRNGDTLIARLIGAALEHIAYGSSPVAARLKRSHDQAQQEQAAARRAYLQRLEREAPQFTAEVEREFRLLEKFEEVKAWYVADSAPLKEWDRLLSSEARRDIMGLTLVPNLAASLLLWAVAAVIAVLPWPASRRELSGAAWLFREAPAPTRITLTTVIGLGLVTGCYWAWTASGNTWLPLTGAFLVLGLFMTLPFSSRRTDSGWSAGSLAAVLALTVLVSVPLALASNLPTFWRSVVPALWLTGTDGAQAAPTGGEFWLPSGALLAGVVPLVVLLVSALRRRTLWQAVNGTRLTFKVLAALLATCYLGYVLFATPASARDARLWDTVVAREAGGDPI